MITQGQGPEPKDVLRFQIQRNITNLFKFELQLLEDLKQEHVEAMDKLKVALSPEQAKYVDLANYFTDKRFQQMRKRILDKGNDTIAEIDENVTHFEITFK